MSEETILEAYRQLIGKTIALLEAQLLEAKMNVEFQKNGNGNGGTVRNPVINPPITGGGGNIRNPGTRGSKR
jgi:hypothetical protein